MFLAIFKSLFIYFEREIPHWEGVEGQKGKERERERENLKQAGTVSAEPEPRTHKL